MTELTVKNLSDELGVAFGTSGVRGLVIDLTPELCYAFVKSFLQSVCFQVTKVAVGMDLRPSSSDIVKACIAAIEDSNMQVTYCGALPTPALAFYAMQNNMAAVMITGSHIPFDRNGIKFYRPDGEISKADEVAIITGQVSVPEFLASNLSNCLLPDVDSIAIDVFKKRYANLFPANMLHTKRIGVYEHSSVARDVIKDLLTYFGADVISLERTDIFVPIDTEAVSEKDRIKGKSWAIEYNLDAIISTDGDGDRPLIADEKGEWLRGDILGVLCADYLNASHVVAPVNVNTVLELRGSKQIPARQALRTKIGSPYVIAGMEMLLQEAPDARVIGYEANGGLLIGSDSDVNGHILHALPTRDSVLPALIVLALSYEQAKPVSELTDFFPERYTASDRIKNMPADKSSQLIAGIKTNKIKQTELLSVIPRRGEELEIVTIDETDGLRMILNNGDIIHLRASGNAPELRCYVETDVAIKAVERVRLVLEQVRKL